MHRRAVCYDRISLDATGEAAGVRRQWQDNETYCKQARWPVIAHLVDNSISASRYSTKLRPGYQQALRLIETGEADALVAWHLDRLWRQPKELEHLIDLAEHRDVVVATVNGEIDLRTGDGRLQARVLVTMAAKESDDKSRRFRRRFEADALAGRPQWTASFGFQPGNIDHDPDQAAHIRDAARQIIDGGSLGVIARQWTAEGLVTPRRAKEWQAGTVAAILRSPRIAGLRSHRGQIVAQGIWEPIIDRATWDLLQAVLADPGRRRPRGPRTEWSGLFRCTCGTWMGRSARNGRPLYRCLARAGISACGQMSIPAIPAQDLVLADFFDHVGHLQPGNPEPAVAPADLVEVERRSVELADLYAAGSIDRGEWLRARHGLERRKADAERLMLSAQRDRRLARWAGRPGDLRTAWPALTVDERRAELDALIERVTVRRGDRPGWSEDRIVVDWRD